MSELVTMDKDYAGEQQFARLTATSLKAFALRHHGDLAVQDAYSTAVRTLEQLAPILAAAEQRTEEDVIRQVAAATAREVAAQTAEAAIAHATTWAQAAPPAPRAADPTPAPAPEPAPVVDATYPVPPESV